MYSIGGWKATSGWFCSSGFGPGPSSGTTPATSRNGLAGPSIKAKKKAATARPTNVAQPTSGSPARSRNPRAPTTPPRSPPRRSRFLHPIGVAGDVGLRVLHHDAVAGEDGSPEPTLEHDRYPRLEQLRWVTRVADGHGDAVVLDGKGDIVR